MFDKLRQSNLLFWSIECLVIATLIFVFTKINFIFSPIGTFFTTLFAPILVAGFLFYLLNPLVSLLMKTGISRNLAIALVFLFLVGVIALLIGAVIPNLIEQLANLAETLPGFVKRIEKLADELMKQPALQQIDFEAYLDKMDISAADIVKRIVNGVSSSFGSIVSKVANVVIVAVTAPFILFYMLKDGHKLVPAIQRYLPAKHTEEVSDLLHKMSQTISRYISGQAIECLFVATATIIGYWLIGVEYAFLFGCIAGITNMIPYLGPYLGLAPAVLVTVFSSPFKAVLACVVVLIVQQLDGNVIYPNVIGKSLDIHPLTIIIILLVAGNIAGLLGMILGVPLYAVCKTIVIYVYDILHLDDKEKV